MRTRFVLSSTLLAAALSGSIRAAVPLVYTNISNLLPNTPNQVLQIYVTGTDAIQGENLNFQINAGGSGPIFTGVDIITATIFAASNTGQSHPNDPGFDAQGIYTAGTFSGHLAAVSTTTVSPAVATDNGLLATLLISTTATNGATFTLNMLNTLNGGSNFGLGDLSGSTLGLSFPHSQFSIGTAVRQWNTNGGGGWNTDANWTPFAPYARGDTANFLGALTAGTAVVTLDGARVAGTLNFNDTAGSYDIQAGAGGSLILDNGSTSALLACLAGKHSISAPIVLASNTDVSVAAGGTLTLAGGVSQAYGLALSGAGKLILTGANSYAATDIAAGSTLQVGNGTTSGSLGTVAVSNRGALTLANLALPLSVPLGGTGTVTVSGNVVFTSTSTADNVVVSSAGAWQVGNGGTSGMLAGGTLANSGLLTFNRSDAALHAAVINGGGTLTQAGSGTTTLSNYHGTGAINVNAGMLALGTTAGARHTSAVLIQSSAVSLAAGTALDLSNHDLLIHGGNAATVEALIGSAYFFGLWNKPGITSSSAQANPITTLGIMSGADYNTYSPTPGLFDGAPVASTDIVVKYTYSGDINLDGLVNDDDFGLFSGAYFFTHTGNYAAGDLNFDGLVNDDDFGVFSGNYFFTPSSPLGGAVAAGPSAAVPEPASLAFFGLGAALLLRRKSARCG